MTEEEIRNDYESLQKRQAKYRLILPFNTYMENVLVVMSILMIVGFFLLYAYVNNATETTNNLIKVSTHETQTNRDVGLRNRVVYCEVLNDLNAPKTPASVALCNDPEMKRVQEQFGG